MSAVLGPDEEQRWMHMIDMQRGGQALEQGQEQVGILQGDVNHQATLLQGESTDRIAAVLDARNTFRSAALAPSPPQGKQPPVFSIRAPVKIQKTVTTAQTYEGMDPSFAQTVAAGQRRLRRWLSPAEIQELPLRQPPPEKKSVDAFMNEWCKDDRIRFMNKIGEVLVGELGHLGSRAMREGSHIDNDFKRDRFLSQAGRHIYQARSKILKCQKDSDCVGFGGWDYHTFADEQVARAREGINEALCQARHEPKTFNVGKFIIDALFKEKP